MNTYIQKPARRTKQTKASWVKWFNDYGPEKFLDAFLHNVEDTKSTCQYCHQDIYVDVLIGGGVPDWSTADGDFGCDMSPESTSEGLGGHMPEKR